jgi:hypothetical protein
MGEWMYGSTFSWSRHYSEVRGELQAPADLSPWNEPHGSHWIGGWAGLDDAQSRLPLGTWKTGDIAHADYLFTLQLVGFALHLLCQSSAPLSGDNNFESFCNGAVHNLFPSPMKWGVTSRRMRWQWQLVRIDEERNVCSVLVGKLGGNIWLGTPKRLWEKILK